MATFSYRAIGPDGTPLEGSLDAGDESAVISHLQGRGLIPLEVNLGLVTDGRTFGRPFAFQRGIRRAEIGELTRELATLLRSGLPLDRALDILSGLAPSERIAEIVVRIRADVRSGSPLSKALEAEPAAFDRFYIGMVRAGEAGGALANALQRIADFMERSKELRETVVSALIYPTILVFASFASVMLLLVFVVPQFSQMFEQSGKALPLPTQVVVGAGTWLRLYWWALPLVVLLVWRYLTWQMSSVDGKRSWDARMLRLPLVGDLIVKVEVARFARTLSTLLVNGLPLLPALAIVRETIGNLVVAGSIDEAREQLQSGSGLSRPLLASGVLPPLAVHMISVGEETGRLDEMLERIADVYDREVSMAVKRMLALLEPVLILGLGLVIGGIILSILLAILKVNSLVG